MYNEVAVSKYADSSIDIQEVEEYRTLCSKWQEILGLSCWNIKLDVVRGNDIDQHCGRVDYSVEDETALIRIKTKLDYFGCFPMDAEVTIVHELLHIVLEKTVDIQHDIIYEQAVTRLAKTLVNINRNSQNTNNTSFDDKLSNTQLVLKTDEIDKDDNKDICENASNEKDNENENEKENENINDLTTKEEVIRDVMESIKTLEVEKEDKNIKEFDIEEDIEIIPYINFLRLCSFARFKQSDWFMALNYSAPFSKLEQFHDIYVKLKRRPTELFTNIGGNVGFLLEKVFYIYSIAYLKDMLHRRDTETLPNWIFKFDKNTFNEFCIKSRLNKDYYSDKYFAYENNCIISSPTKNDKNREISISVIQDRLAQQECAYDIIVSLKEGTSLAHTVHIPVEYVFRLDKEINKHDVSGLIDMYGSYIVREYLLTIQSLFGYYRNDKENFDYIKSISFNLVDSEVM